MVKEVLLLRSGKEVLLLRSGKDEVYIYCYYYRVVKKSIDGIYVIYIKWNWYIVV